MAAFSSRGPSFIDYAAKPDLVAPGVGIESLADATSTLFATHPAARLWGTLDTATQPYLSLSGTSMAAPVVTGTVALMMQANPALTPNLVKAILQYTAEHKSRYDDLTQGAGFLNARGAVQLAKSFVNGADLVVADPTAWNKHINWGNHRIGGGVLRPDANAWGANVIWGSSTTDEGDTIVWGTTCGEKECDNTVWNNSPDEDTVVWGTSSEEDTIVWGTSDETNIVWGTACGGADCNSVMWGVNCATEECANTVWSTSTGEDNIVWGTSAEDEDNIVWGARADIADVNWSAPPAGQSISASLTLPPPAYLRSTC
jgi:hypothetical protein